MLTNSKLILQSTLIGYEIDTEYNENEAIDHARYEHQDVRHSLALSKKRLPPQARPSTLLVYLERSNLRFSHVGGAGLSSFGKNETATKNVQQSQK